MTRLQAIKQIEALQYERKIIGRNDPAYCADLSLKIENLKNYYNIK